MLVGFHLIHKKHPDPTEITALLANGPVFQTCLRAIQFCWSDESFVSPKGFEYFSGEKAYEFLLEAICGLHSPVVGETEVFGQFKNFKNKENWPYQLQLIFENAIVDTKKIRDKHLKDLGGQSYGSVVRKHSREHSSVAFIGGGQFTEELLPWVYKEDKEVLLYLRDPQKAQSFMNKYPKIKVLSLNDHIVTSDVVIVAAPITAQYMEGKVSGDTKLVLDLRGESRYDASQKFSRVITLDQIFNIIESHQQQIVTAKSLSLEAIREASLKRSLFELMRPFGWDDICVW